MNDNIYDSTLIKAISLANVFNYAISEPDKSLGADFINKYLDDNDISPELVDLYIKLLYDLLDEMNKTDFDLQYNQDDLIDNGVFTPIKKDTVFTLSVLDKVFDLSNFDNNSSSDSILLLQQATTNVIKYQCKYAIISLQFLFDSM